MADRTDCKNPILCQVTPSDLVSSVTWDRTLAFVMAAEEIMTGSHKGLVTWQVPY